MNSFVTKIASAPLFLAMYAFALLTRSRRAPRGVPEHIVIIAGGKLGDIVCVTPILRALRTHFSKATVLMRDTDGMRTALLADSGLVDGFLNEKGILAFSRRLRASKIDTVLMTGPSYDDLVPVLLARVRTIVVPRVVGATTHHQTRRYLALLPFVSVFEHQAEGAYVPRERLRVLEPLGVTTDDTKKALGYSEKARTTIDAFLAEHGLTERPYAIVAPTVANKIKTWPPERFARVVEHLVARGLPVVVSGEKNDREEVSVMMRALAHSAHVVDTTGQFSLDELKAVIARAALFVSVDTGPIYIAEAFDVPTVDIIGPMAEDEQPPRGERHVVVVAQREKAATHIMSAHVYGAQERTEARRQVEAITVEMVCEAIDGLLARV